MYSCNVFEACGIVRFQKDGKLAYMETNKGAELDLTALVLFDPETGKTEMEESDPLKKVDLGAAVFSDASYELALTLYQYDRPRLYFSDKGFESDFKWLLQKLPGKEVGRITATRDEQLWLVNATSDTEPGEVYILDRRTHKLTPQYKVREKL